MTDLSKAVMDKEFLMKKKHVFFVLLACLLAFGLLVIGCNNDSSDDEDDDPVKVNLSLPNITAVPAFTGTFVSSEAEALNLVQDAVDALGEFTGALGGGASSDDNKYSISRGINMSRRVENEPINYTFENEQLAEGVTANGFITGYYKESTKDDYTETVGDYYEESIRAKLSLDFNSIQQRHITFNGKYVYDEDLYMKDQVTSINPQKGKGTLRLNANNGYALSASKNGKGLKFVMKLTANCNFSVDYSYDDNDDFYYDDDDFLKDKLNLKLTIDVYDNDNVKQYTKVYTDLDEASEFLGDSIMGL